LSTTTAITGGTVCGAYSLLTTILQREVTSLHDHYSTAAGQQHAPPVAEE